MPYLRIFSAHNLCLLPQDNRGVKEMKKIWIIALCLLLTGCTMPPLPKSKFVTGMEVKSNDPTLCRMYTEPQKMETVLYYLRSMDNRKPAQSDPERYSGRSYHIKLYYSDGSNSHIFQRADRFISEDFRPWEELERRYGAFLEPLLRNMESD